MQLKKYIAGLAIVLTAVTSCKKQPNGYTINGIMDKDLGIDSVFVYKNVKNKFTKLSKAPLVNGKFKLTGVVDTIQHLYVGNVTNDAFTTLILENDTYKVTLTKEEMKAEGGNINEMVLGYMNSKEFTALGDKNIKNGMKAMNEKDEAVKAALTKEIQKTVAKMDAIEDKALAKVIDDETKPAEARLLALIHSMNFMQYDEQKRKELLTDIEKNLDSKYTKIISAYRTELEQSEKSQKMKAKIGKGKPYKPAFGIDVNGKELLLKDYVSKNKYTLLEFWASWCAPCRAEIPVLKQAYKKFKNKGFEIYSLSIDEKEDDWKLALKEDKTSWIQTLVQGKEGAEVITSYGVDGIPASYLIDQNGTIVATNDELRGEKLEELLSELLK